MCTIFLAYRVHPQYPLVLLGNRDEFLNRPTRPAQIWDEHPAIIGGKDEKAGGMWWGIHHENGRWAALTNIRDPHNFSDTAWSRGNLVKDFLLSAETPYDYLNRLQQNASSYNGFNLWVGTPQEVGFFNTQENAPLLLAPGIYGLSNETLDSPWCKVIDGKQAFASLLQNQTLDVEQAFTLLKNTQMYDDALLPNTGVPIEWERKLSALFVEMPNYGTRASTLMVIQDSGKGWLEERSYYNDGKLDKDNPLVSHFSFQLQKPNL